MPQLSKVDAAQVGTYFRARGERDLSEYTSIVEAMQPGDVLAATPTNGETARAVKRGLTMAAHKLGMNLQYAKGRQVPDGQVIFRLRETPAVKRGKITTVAEIQEAQRSNAKPAGSFADRLNEHAASILDQAAANGAGTKTSKAQTAKKGAAVPA